MESEWPFVALKELVDPRRPITYGVVKPGAHDPSGIRFVRGGDISNGRIALDQLRTITEAVSNQYKRTLLKGGELLVSLVGNPGEVAIAPPSLSGANIARQVGMVCLGDAVEPRYVQYFLASPMGKRALGAKSLGSVQTVINLRDLKRVELPVPSRAIQRAITTTLGAIDDRIDLLRQTNVTLEAIAQALFKSWFVDFDPVHAKSEGRAPEAMDAATAALFPSEFEQSELGLIPKGWHVERLSDLVELAYGKALKASDRVGGDIPVYGSGGVTGWHDVALVKEPTIIIGRKGSVGTIYWEDRPCHPIDTVFFVRSQKVPLSLCLQVLQSLGLDKMNTDAAVPGLNRKNAYRLEVVVAPTAVNDAWQKIAEPIYDAISSNSRRCEVLFQLRDTLLPRLISGRLRLPEACELAGADA